MAFRILIIGLTLASLLNSKAVYSMENKLGEPDVFIHYAIFFGKQEQELNSEDLTKQCDLKGIERITSFDSFTNKPGVIIKNQDVGQLPVPSLQALQYFGRGFDQAKADRIMESDYSVSFIGVGPFDKDHSLLKKITICVYSVAKKYNAFVYDVADSLTFTSDSFANIRVNEISQGFFSSSQFGVRAYRVERGIRSVSMGLEKFGQPNLAIENFSEHHMGYMDKLFTLVLQHVIESRDKVVPGPISIDVNNISNPMLQKNMQSSIVPNGIGRARLVLKKAVPHDGDPSELLAITFENPPGDSLWDEQAKLLLSIFGRDRDISSVPDSASLDEAIASAKMRAKDILEEGHTLEKDGMRLLLAVALEETKEVIWVEVSDWEGQKGIGILLSDPIHTKSLRSGMKYEFNYAFIMDFKLYGPDGLLEQGGVDELARRAGSRQ
jgi:uncharacterized protein YegJ (DUF2314 family)